MGPPDLPCDFGQDESLSPSDLIYNNITSDSDNDSNNEDGYEPLPMSDEAMPMDQDEYDNDATNHYQAVGGGDALPPVNVPHIESIDVEIERQVWSEPRPQELQIELDNTKTTQILNAMANFTLPNVVVPQWAAGVPEEMWKAALLQSIRHRTEVHSVESNVSNDEKSMVVEKNENK